MLTNGLVDQQNNGTPFSSCEKIASFFIYLYYHQNHSIHLCAAEILRWIFATKTKETKEKNACLTLHIYSN